MRKITIILIYAVLLTGSLCAQYIIKPTYFNVTGVSNAGIVAGYEEWAGPYSLWNPETGAIETIGGAAEGNGIGGAARFSTDGNYISGTNFTDVPINTDWQRHILSDYNFIFKAIEFPESGGGFYGYAAGQSLTYNGNGIVLKTSDGGTSWSAVWTDDQHRGIEAMSFPTDLTGYVGGWNQYFSKTADGGWGWEQLDPGGNDNVYIYTGIAFKDENNGVVTAQLDDGFAVYVTADGGLNWTPGSGLAGIPYKITHVSGDTYFLVTNGGQVQKSVNNGLNWTTVHNFPGSLLLGVNFYNDLIGYVLAETYIYKTVDGGQNWTMQNVGPDVLWHDVDWIDESNVILTGTPDVIYESTNGGANWFWANQTISTLDPALYDISVIGNKVHICGSQGTFYQRSTVASQTVSEMARYDVTAHAWQQAGNLGFVVDGATSSGYDISGDGLTVVGNSWADPANGNGTTSYAEAVAWNPTDGLVSLGSLYAYMNSSTRANAVNYDGSVIVGWQDYNGPWKAAVWRRNPAGGYFPNVYLLIDQNGSALDENNQLGMAQAVSGDGNWIGGQGDWANNGDPWLWSESTGYISLGSMPNGNGTVMGINWDGTMVVGYFDMGMWDPRIPFIWTPSDGLQNFNDYVTQTLGYDMGTTVINTPMDFSKNGRYVAGAGFDPAAGEWGEYITFRLEFPNSAVEEPQPETVYAKLEPAYPNPFNPETTISYTVIKTGDLSLKVYDAKGQLVRTLVNDIREPGRYTVVWNGKDNSGNSVASGMYIYRMQTDKFTSTRKMLLIK